MENLVLEIQKELKTLANEEIARHSQRFFKTGKGEYGEGDIFLGIRVPVLRKLSQVYKNAGLDDITLILKSSYHEERLLALFLLVNLFIKSNRKDRSKIYILYLASTHYINNWDLVDTSSDKIVGAYLYDRSRKPLYRLAKSKNLWQRRIAIMATFYFIRKNDFKDTLEISMILLNDREDLIHKAVGWMLREIGNRDREVEEKFLKSHYHKMPRTMLRYAIEKFPEKKRKLYLMGNI